MAAENKISVRAFNGALVKLAFSYIEAEAPVQALGLLACMPADYFANALPEDGAADSDLTHSAEGVAMWLTSRGHVDQDPVGQYMVGHEMGKA